MPLLPGRPPITKPPPASCQVAYTVNSWNAGLTADITITNPGAAIDGWSPTFTLPGGQSITSGGNATCSPSSGQVIARSVGHHAAIPPAAR
jgi:acetylxylan esterase